MTWLLVAAAVQAENPKYADPNQVDADYAVQGEYAGEVVSEGQKRRAGVQVIALGEGKFQAVGYWGGLPGAGWNGEGRLLAEGQRTDQTVSFCGEGGSALYQNGVLDVRGAEGHTMGQLSRVDRQSPTLGQSPPADATVLFDGSNVDHWNHGRRTEDGLLMEGTTSRPTFQSHRLHVEFRLPYQPLDRGQARGNSGVYLQGRYEVQMLDSFGLEVRDNECGGIYSIKAPEVNMCLPPLTWQTFDIEFRAARYDDQGKQVAHPRMTVLHNGVLIHQDVELPHATTAAPLGPGPEAGPVYLQDHGCPIRYRNIWTAPLADAP